MKKVKISTLTGLTEVLATDKLLVQSGSVTALGDAGRISNLLRKTHTIPAGTEIDSGIGPARSFRVYQSPDIGFYIAGATATSVKLLGETTTGRFGDDPSGTQRVLAYRKSLNSNIFFKNTTVNPVTIVVQYYME